MNINYNYSLNCKMHFENLFAIQVALGKVPLGSANECAKAIVESACRGDMYVTYPCWYKVLFPWKLLHPQFVDWACNLASGPYQKK